MSAAQTPQRPIAGSGIPQFAQELPQLSLTPNLTKSPFLKTITGNTAITLRMCEFKAAILPATGVAGLVKPYSGTWVWGYLVDPTGTSTCKALVAANTNKASGLVETYLGPIIANAKGKATTMTFINDLGRTSTTNVLAYKYSTDLTLHWADPQGDTMRNKCMGKGPILPGDPCANNYDGPIAAVPHLHGGEVPPEIDGGPDAWYTSDGKQHGSRYYASTPFPPARNATIYNYPNEQDAAPIWFHDHTLGATRLNVFAGLAGGYYIYDTKQKLATGLGGLAALTGVIPLILQDRMFDDKGQLFFPADTAGGTLWTTNPDHPYWVPEFIGDTIVVNGKAWPFVNVEPKRYRVLFLNGSNARTYELFLTNPKTNLNGPSLYMIGTDGGYLDSAVRIDPNAATPAPQHLLIMPGERYEAIIDFTAFAGQTLDMNNVANTPYPDGVPVAGGTDKVVQFRVAATCTTARPDALFDPATSPTVRFEPKIERLVNPAAGTIAPGVTVTKTRALTLNEVLKPAAMAVDPVTGVMTSYPGGPLEILVNNTTFSGESLRRYNDFTIVKFNGDTIGFSETPQEGETEVWEIINTTADAHPIHLHLVQFQLLNRQNYDLANYMQLYNASFPADAKLPAGVYHPGFGPPLSYRPSMATGMRYGGNPDVTAYLQGPVMPPQAHEAGWKDTVTMLPGQVTRIAVRWAPTAPEANTPASKLYFAFDPSGNLGQYSYVWHCHIIDHEDNEMMRPDYVVPNKKAIRTVIKGVAY